MISELDNTEEMNKESCTYRGPVGLGGLATAKVAQGPGGVAKHAELAAVAQQVKQRLQCTAAQHVVAALGAVTGNVTESPDGLLSHIRLRAGEELDKDWDGTGLDDNLGLSGAARCDVGQGPCGLELNEGVRRSEEFDKAADDTGLDDLLDRRVALLRQKLSETGSSLNLEIDLLGEDALYHLGKVFGQLWRVRILYS